ncbi:unnamed protein product [Gongylonema pulchrum]|uniref:Small ribosomal subunit protein eS4 n=2 Tax=Gongylonema pulchrum TaxID=637853 RepID=A0A183DPW0_9BILA|nr:unnamed protein product [Gongylonema pulchrum]
MSGGSQILRNINYRDDIGPVELLIVIYKECFSAAIPRTYFAGVQRSVFAPRPRCGPHKLRESLPLILFLRNRLKYALTYNEARMICKQRLIKVDGKVRTDMHVIRIDKTDETFRLLYDSKGRYATHRITENEGKFKLCKVVKKAVGPKGVPFVVTHDARTIRYPDPHIKGNVCMVTGGRNMGRVGIVGHREKHPGSFDIVHVKDAVGHSFATRLNNVFIIGRGPKAMVSLPGPTKGVRLTIAEERDRRLAQKRAI